MSVQVVFSRGEGETVPEGRDTSGLVLFSVGQTARFALLCSHEGRQAIPQNSISAPAIRRGDGRHASSDPAPSTPAVSTPTVALLLLTLACTFFFNPPPVRVAYPRHERFFQLLRSGRHPPPL